MQQDLADVVRYFTITLTNIGTLLEHYMTLTWDNVLTGHFEQCINMPLPNINAASVCHTNTHRWILLWIVYQITEKYLVMKLEKITLLLKPNIGDIYDDETQQDKWHWSTNPKYRTVYIILFGKIIRICLVSKLEYVTLLLNLKYWTAYLT